MLIYNDLHFSFFMSHSASCHDPDKDKDKRMSRDEKTNNDVVVVAV